LKNGGGVNRFANSRCKPPGLNKPFVPRRNRANNDGGSTNNDGKKFKNTGF
jgi:hypothetical protein